jgi:solute carrier family 45, member 1/2/4
MSAAADDHKQQQHRRKQGATNKQKEEEEEGEGHLETIELHEREEVKEADSTASAATGKAAAGAGAGAQMGNGQSRHSCSTARAEEEGITKPLTPSSSAPAIVQPSLGGHHPLPRLPLYKLLLATVVSLGVQVDWAVQAALLMPYLLIIGVPYKYYTIVCLCGPISGLVVQPYMGVFSDHCHSRFGRRRPFIFAGVLLIVLGFMLMANATYLGSMLPGAKAERAGAVTAAIIGLWIIDMSNNALAGPCRALVADIAPVEQQRLGNALMAVWSSVGSVIGFLICAIPFSRINPNLESTLCRLQCADLRVVATICAVLLLFTSALTIGTTHEVPLTRGHAHAPQGERSPLGLVRKIFHTLFHMPPALARVCAFQFVSWLSWFHHTLYIAVWVGKVVNQGDGSAAVGSEEYMRYERGIKAASLGLVLFATLTGLVSAALPRVLRRFKTRPTLAISQLLLAMCYGATFLVPRRQVYFAAAIIACFALPWAVFLVVPWALVAQMAPPDKRGLYMGSLNIFACVPQVIVALSGPILVRMFGEDKATQAALGFGGAFGGCGRAEFGIMSQQYADP